MKAKRTKKEIVAELREQDKMLNEIMARRRAIADECYAISRKYYNEVWDALYKDSKPHWNF